MSTMFHVCIRYEILVINKWERKIIDEQSQRDNSYIIFLLIVFHNKSINLDKGIKQKNVESVLHRLTTFGRHILAGTSIISNFLGVSLDGSPVVDIRDHCHGEH